MPNIDLRDRFVYLEPFDAELSDPWDRFVYQESSDAKH